MRGDFLQLFELKILKMVHVNQNSWRLQNDK